MRPRKTRIHRGLVGDRTLVGSSYLSRTDLRQEYQSEIAPRTEAALRRIFEQCELRPPRRLLDLGAGTGAAARVVRSRFGDGVELVAVDKVPGPGILVADVLRGVRPAGVSGRFDLIICAHLLNELGDRLDLDGRARLLAGWCRDLLELDGTCIVIEPALRDTSRALLGVRDRLLAAGLHVVAPCFCQTACPALQRDRDWCHDSAEVLIAGRSRVDFSYLVVRRSAATEVDPGRYRVVSDPLKDKGRLRFFVCGVSGRFVLMRLDRDRSAANQALDRARRGDIVVLPNAPVQDEGIRVGANSTVRIG
ncbi:MAG TPA: small ribosomal subunit Rsm22 family protein [Polyangia bacterium]|jgi:Predicted rRNA methylase|nr:small ribosomal subunit Rsm22 family protein [Polyangia bacterium]